MYVYYVHGNMRKFETSAVDGSPHPILVLCHPVGKNTLKRTINILSFLEIQATKNLEIQKSRQNLNLRNKNIVKGLNWIIIKGL